MCSQTVSTSSMELDYATPFAACADDDIEFHNCNPQVQELESGHIWWYNDQMLQSVAEDQVPEHLKHPPYPGEHPCQPGRATSQPMHGPSCCCSCCRGLYLKLAHAVAQLGRAPHSQQYARSEACMELP